MKSYTDLEQSKKLAEILPLESADMCYGIDDDTLKYNNLPWLIPYNKYTAKEYYIPCWSLAALLKLIPIIDENSYQLVGTLDGGAICKHPCTCIMYQEKEPIDAVFNMIVWLKESKYI